MANWEKIPRKIFLKNKFRGKSFKKFSVHPTYAGLQIVVKLVEVQESLVRFSTVAGFA